MKSRDEKNISPYHGPCSDKVQNETLQRRFDQAWARCSERQAFEEANRNETFEDGDQARVHTMKLMLMQFEEDELAKKENRIPRNMIRLLGGVRPNRWTNKPKKKRRNVRRYRMTQSPVTRGPFKDAVVVPLTYDDPVIIRTNIGGTVVSWPYKLNSAFDIDPAFASAAIVGFAEWSQSYTRYRVLSARWDIEICNGESFPVVMFVTPMIQNPGNNNAASYQFTGNRYGQTHVSPSIAGGAARKFTGLISMKRLSGNPGFNFDDNYAGNTTTLGGNPTTILYLLVGATTGIFGLPPVFTAAGLTCRIKLTLKTKFYMRTQLTQ